MAAFFGAFDGNECASQLGIVLCGQDSQGRLLARYQSVQTAVEHSGRGLAGGGSTHVSGGVGDFDDDGKDFDILVFAVANTEEAFKLLNGSMDFTVTRDERGR